MKVPCAAFTVSRPTDGRAASVTLVSGLFRLDVLKPSVVLRVVPAPSILYPLGPTMNGSSAGLAPFRRSFALSLAILRVRFATVEDLSVQAPRRLHTTAI